MPQIKDFLESNTPFAVMQYFESLKTQKKETVKKYELIYLNEKNYLSFKILEPKEVSFLKQNTDRIKLVIENQDGKVYEFENFKKHKKTNAINH